MTIGAYGGSQIVNGKTEALQMVNMNQVDKVEKAGVMNVGQIVGHETIEAFVAAKENGGANRANTANGDAAYDKGHNAAISLDPNFVPITSTQKMADGSTLIIFNNNKTVIIK